MHMLRPAPRHIALLLAAFAAQSLLAGTVNWTGTASGNWSNGSNWSTSPSAPATSGDDIVFNYLGLAAGTTITSTVDAAWSSVGAVNSLTFAGGDSVANSYTLAGEPGVVLSLGAGGLTSGKTLGTITLSANMDLAANQTWSLSGSGNNGRVFVLGNWSGTGNLTVNAGSTNFILGGGTFSAWTGSLTLGSGTIQFNDAAQLGRLGTGTATLRNTVGTGTTLFFNTGGDTSSVRTVSTNLSFEDTGSGIYGFSASGGMRGTLALSGDLSSTTALGESIRFSGIDSDATGALFRYRVSGNNSGLTSLRDASWSDSAVSIRNAFVYLGSANALGANNGLGTSIGEYNSALADRSAGLFTTSGNNVTAGLRVKLNGNGGGVTQRVYLGLEGAGAATFSGNILLEGNNTATNRAPNVYLKADSGGVVTFSGAISNQNDSFITKTANVFVQGGGTVVLSGNNSYTAKTTVETGTTLLVNNTVGSGTGSGEVEVASGATLGGTGISAGAVTLLAGGTLSPGSGGAGIFSGGSSFTWNSNGTSGGIVFDLGATQGLSDSLVFTGAFTKGSGSSFLFDFGGNPTPSFTYTLLTFGSNSGFSVGDFGADIAGTFGLTANSLTFTTASAIPEPAATATLAGLAVAILGLTRSRRCRG